ncbi:hypothetical protein CRENBAI_004182 [Crenichthys baileyi]|uniref:Pentraxin (PTX) domain-containing protein n=1 Tax=Crenichthys baileyi TaxID=28760 RepID=A0AAV9S6B8_9TELE
MRRTLQPTQVAQVVQLIQDGTSMRAVERMHWLFIPILSLLVCVQSLLLAFRVKSRSPPYDKLYYEYFSRRLQWKAAEELCKLQSGTLATVSNSAENQQLTSILKYWNISHPVWIGRKILTHQKNSSMILILDFSSSLDGTYARLLHKFPSMSSVTICTQLRFNPNSFGISTIFSYSINDFQLRANLAQGRPVQLALLIHGKQGSYAEAFEHDDSWHSVCVSWSQDGGRWALYAHGHMVSSGNGVNSNDDIIGPNGSFILGERQNGGSFMSNDSFRGSITDLHIWDRVLSTCEILTMEKECSTISSGLVLRWSEASLEIEVSLRRLQGKSPCQGTV